MTTINNDSKIEENNELDPEDEKFNTKELYVNSLRESKNRKNSLNIKKVNYDDYSKNLLKTDQIDLEKFYETKQKKIEDILLKKTSKINPNLFVNKESLRKSEDLNKPSTRTSIKRKLVYSPISNKGMKRSKSSSSIKKNKTPEISKTSINGNTKNSPSNFQIKTNIFFSEDRQTNKTKKIRKNNNHNELKNLFKMNNNRPSSDDKKHYQPELKVEIRNNKIINIVTQTNQGNLILSEVSSPLSSKNSNIYFNENMFNIAYFNNNLTAKQNNLSVNSFRKNFCSNKRNNDNPIAFVNINNLKNNNYIVNNCLATNHFNDLSSQQHLEKNNMFLTKSKTKDTKEVRKNIINDTDLIKLEEKKIMLDDKINNQLSILREKLNSIKDEKETLSKDDSINDKTSEKIIKNEIKKAPIIVKESSKNEINFDSKNLIISPNSLSKSLVEEKYHKMIKEICEKRKDIKSNI